MRLETLELGPAGPAIVFVHGSLNDGITAFQAQRDLSARWRLRIPNRRGYGNSPLTDRVDPDVDAGDIVEILEAGAHLVGTSMGGVIAARAAARAPERVRSLTLIEPPAFPNAIDMPEVATVAQAMKDHWATAERSDATAFMRGFLRALGAGAPAPSTLSPAAEKAAHNLMTEAPWLTAVPAEDVARTSCRPTGARPSTRSAIASQSSGTGCDEFSREPATPCKESANPSTSCSSASS
jgi:pimeloyl-ACP methyl ester carboxylesterase